MKNYSQGSNSMYADYDNLQSKPAPKKMKLRIANCRGLKPVLTDIKKARTILQNIGIEINGCPAKDAIDKCTSLLWDILEDNKKY